METLEINNLQMTELSHDEMMTIDGGGGESAWYWIAYGVGFMFSEPMRNAARHGAGGYGGALR